MLYCNVIPYKLQKEGFPLKYWRGYLVALIFAAIGWALVWFASSHTALVDMVYPYMDRLIINSLADWSANVSGCPRCLSTSLVFKTSAFNHSAIPPRIAFGGLAGSAHIE